MKIPFVSSSQFYYFSVLFFRIIKEKDEHTDTYRIYVIKKERRAKIPGQKIKMIGNNNKIILRFTIKKTFIIIAIKVREINAIVRILHLLSRNPPRDYQKGL